MTIRNINRCFALTVLAGCCQLAAAGNNLNIINWSGYVSDDALEIFKKETGTNIKYDVLDSDDTLQAKLLGGGTGYDVTYPSSTYMAKQVEAGVYEKIDWSKIPNRVNLDPVLMSKVAAQDPGNQYGVPYLWGTDGLIVNMTKVRKILGPDAKVDGWDLIFNPEIASKLSACGISVMDSGSDIVPIMVAYMGRDPMSITADDVNASFDELNKARPHWTQFSTSYLNDVAGGDICVAAGWSGDASVIKSRVAESGSGDEIVYLTPKGSTGLWFTMMGIPKDAPNKDNAYKWINHLLSNEMAASTVDFIGFTSVVMSARPLVSEARRADITVYPPQEMIDSAFTFLPIEPKLLKLINKNWLRLKSAG